MALAAYGDYAPWYIGTAVAYQQGGYETGPDASNVAPEEKRCSWRRSARCYVGWRRSHDRRQVILSVCRISLPTMRVREKCG